MKTLAREKDKVEILRRLSTIKPDTSPRWGRMSAHQMVCHLADACRMASGDKVVTPLSGPLPPVMFKWIALYLPLPWPRGIATRPELDQLCGGTRPADFDADLARAATRLEGLTTQSAWPPHPIFGTMSRTDWLRWGYVHTAHHLRQFDA